MLNSILRRAGLDPSNTADPHVRSICGRFAGAVGIVLNLLLFAAKLIAGLLSGSVSVVADAVNNLSDASSSLISLIGFRLADKPADAEHPYGHGRYEYIAAMMVAVLILVIGVELFRSSLDKVLHPETVRYSAVTIAALVCSILVKAWMMFFNRRLGKRISSGALYATAADSRNDAVTTLLVLVAALVSHVFRINLDGWMGLAVAVFILISGFGLVRDTIGPMLGQAPNPEFVEEIRKKVLSYPFVLGTHDLMIHDYGPGRQFASVHVEMPASKSAMECHEIIDTIERDMLREKNLHMIVHYDPIADDDSLTADLHRWLGQQVRTIDPRLSIHDLRIVPGKHHSNLVFDCVVPPEIARDERAIREKIEETVHAKYPDYFCVINFDQSYIPISQ